MDHDPVRGVTVQFGGQGPSGLLGNLWEWDGADWRRLASFAPPAGLQDSSVVWEAASSRILLFGARGRGGPHGETWVATLPPARFETFGRPCPASQGRVTLSAAEGPGAGQSFQLDVINLPAWAGVLLGLGVSRSLWGGLTLPLPLDPLGYPGCTVYASLDVVVALSNVSGTAAWRVGIPAHAALLGHSLFCQAIVSDAFVQGGLALSDAGEARIGF
jgi:hypothetical protein